MPTFREIASGGLEAKYTGDFLDIGFKDTVRVWAEIEAENANGETPKLQVRHSLGFTDAELMWDKDGDGDVDSVDDDTDMWDAQPNDTMWQSWGEWKDWTVGEIEAQLVQHRILYPIINGDVVVKGFRAIVDVPPRRETKRNVSVPIGGLNVTFAKQFHVVPVIKTNAVNEVKVAIPSNETATGFTVTVYDMSGTDAGGTISWTAETE